MARSYADYFSKNMPFPTFVYLIKANVGWEFSPIYNKDRDISVSFPEKKNTLKKIESQKIEMEKEKKELSLDVLLENRHTENNPKS
jgi:hypothetical protein